MTSGLPTTRGRLSELAVVFLRLGILGFGGPAAHIAMMRDEVVRRRRWMTDQMFLDLVGATNLIPGPNSTEIDRKSTRLNSSHLVISYAVFCLEKKKTSPIRSPTPLRS